LSDNVEVVRDQFAAVNERDFPRAMGHYADDVELVVDPRAFLEPGTYRGREAVGAWFGNWFRTFEPGYRFEIEEVRDLGDVVVLVASHRGRGRSSGIEVQGETGYLYRLRSGKIVGVELYPSRAEVLAAAHDTRRHDMTLQRMDNVLIVVEDLEAATAFFAELGMELEGQTQVEGPSVDSTVGLDGVRADITMMRTPDGHGRVELSKFHTPPAVRAEPESAPANTLGIRRIMFAVDDIDDVVARLRRHGGELVGEIAQYEDSYRLCFLRGPEGIIIGLAEQLG
jgi:ketosteroid isomerase-like protein/catechol 2,3-dioxygenase-like lactoylglutathione lyase family enzyme